MLLQPNMHDARQHQAEKGRGYPGLWSLRNLGALEAGPIASHRTASAVLVRDEAWKIAPKSIALEAGRLVGGGVSPPSAQAYASPSYIWVGPPGAQQVELAGLLVGWGWFLRAGCRCPGNHLGGTWRHLERPSAKTQQPPSQVKPACTQGSRPQKPSQNCAALISILTHSPTPLRSLIRPAHCSSAQAQLNPA